MTKSTKEKILDAAEELFAEQGVDGASLRAITTKADANLGSIHYYFGSKQNLLRELLEARAGEHQNSRFEDLKTSIDNGKKSPLELWKIYSHGFLNTAKNNPHLFKLISQLLWGPDPKYSEILMKLDRKFDDVFVKEVLGFIPKEFHKAAEIRCRILMSLIAVNCIDVFKLGGNVDLSSVTISKEELIDELADMAVHAMNKFQPSISRPA